MKDAPETRKSSGANSPTKTTKGKTISNSNSNIGYTIVSAAEAAGVSVHDIEDAIRSRALVARRAAGDKAVILGTDLGAWLETLPNWTDGFAAPETVDRPAAWIAAHPDWETTPVADLARAGMTKAELKSLFSKLAAA